MCGKVVESIAVRTWKEDDIEYVSKSIAREQWGHTRRDVERCWRWEPDGCFIAESESGPVGHVSTICYGRLGWIGLLIVHPEKRGKGIGTTLIRRAIRYLKLEGAETIRLEAEETAVSLYRSLGFNDEFDSLRFAGRKNRSRIELSAKEIIRMQSEDVERLLALDSKYFGSPRLRVLKKLFEDAPSHCFVANHGQEPAGYIMARKIRDAFWVGPWVCEDSSLSRKLLEACISTIEDENTELRLGFPSANESMSTLARMKGFEFKGKNVRMVFGISSHQGVPQGVYGLAGPEKG